MSFISLEFAEAQLKKVKYLLSKQKTKEVLDIGIDQGFFDQEVRIIVFQYFLNTDKKPKNNNCSLEITQDSYSIQRDVERSYRFVTEEEEAQKKKEYLLNFLYRFLSDNPKCNYVQGLHETAQFFIENFKKSEAQCFFDQIVLLLIPDLMDETKVHVAIKKTMLEILQFLKKDFDDKIQIQHIGKFISLYFSLFANLDNPQTTLRIWDYLICLKLKHKSSSAQMIISIVIASTIRFILLARGFGKGFDDEQTLQLLSQFNLSTL